MFYTAIIMGFVGSLHCIGMCSPLVMMASGTGHQFLLRRIVYNVSRIIPYAMLGAIAGSFGTLLQFPQLQYWLSLGFGVGLVLVGITGIRKSFTIPFIAPIIGKVVSKIKLLFSKYLSKKTWSSFFVLGFLNGFIPCGLTYIAASYCLLLPNAVSGSLFMIFFGLGTIPAMIGFPFIITHLLKSFKFNLKKVASIAIVVLGCSVIARASLIPNQGSTQSTHPIVICK
jgi:hypothetical protein